MQDVLAKLKDIAEKSDNRDINDAIKSAEMTQTVVAEKQEPTVDEVHEVIAEEEVVNEIPTSNEISDLLRLSGQSGVLGINQPSVIIKEDEVDEGDLVPFTSSADAERKAKDTTFASIGDLVPITSPADAERKAKDTTFASIGDLVPFTSPADAERKAGPMKSPADAERKAKDTTFASIGDLVSRHLQMQKEKPGQ